MTEDGAAAGRLTTTTTTMDTTSTTATTTSTTTRGARTLAPLLGPAELREGFQVSVHACPRLLLRELQLVFPGRFQRRPVEGQALAVLTCQRSLMDLSQFGVDADREKDRLLETFVAFAQHVTSALIARKFWADFIDPCSGLPMLTRQSNKVYSEVDGVELLLRYRCLSAGMCKILVHPLWGGAVYPASLFTDAPFDVVREVLETVPDESWLAPVGL